MNPLPANQDRDSKRLWWIGKVALWILVFQVVALLIVAKMYVRAAAPAPVTVVPQGADRTLFGKTEQQRRELFKAIVEGESADRETAEAESETAIWNRNHDNYFHQRESWRLLGAAQRFGIPLWQVAFILDEGIRAHWPPPPGVVLRADDAPLRRTTLPLKARRIITAAP